MSGCVCQCVCVHGHAHVYTQHTAPGRILRGKLGVQRKNIPYVLTLSGLSLFLNTVAIFFEAKIKGHMV